MKKTDKPGFEFSVDELAEGEELPLDTLGGIMQKVQKIRNQAKASGKRAQCPSTFTNPGRRSSTTVFCTLDEGHDGDHKGFRKKWPNTKKGDKS